MKVRVLSILFIGCLAVVGHHRTQGLSFSLSKDIYENKQILHVNIKNIPNTLATLKDGNDIKHMYADIFLSSEPQPEKIECKATINNNLISTVVLENTKVDKTVFDHIFHTFYNAFSDGVPVQLEKETPFIVQKEISNIDTFNKESDTWKNCLYALIKLINNDETYITLKAPFLIGMISRAGKYFNIALDIENFPRFGEKKRILLEVAYKTERIAGGDFSYTEIYPENSFMSLVGKDKVTFNSIVDWNLRSILLQLCDRFIEHYFFMRKYKMATGKLILNTKNNYKVTIDDRVIGGTWKKQEIDLIRFTYDLATSLENESSKDEVTTNEESNFWSRLRAKLKSWRWW